MQEPRDLAALVRAAARSGPGRPALICPDRTVSWGDLDALVDAVAAGLSALDLPAERGYPARVAIALPNVPEFAAVLFGALRAGLVAVPVNPEYTPRELRHVLADSGAAVLVSTRDVAAAVAGIRADLPALRHVHPLGGDGLAALTAPRPATVEAPGCGGEDLAVLLYTSGTEGEPKGAMLSHRALVANHEQLARVTPAPLGRDDRVLLALPLFHAYGLNCGLGAVVYHGACGVLVERFDPAGTLELIERHRLTALLGVPSMFLAWGLLAGAGAAMASVRLAVSGAAPLDGAAATRFAVATGHPVLVGYGLTETAPVVTSTLASPAPKPESIGRPLPGVQVRLVGPAGEVIWPDAGGAEPEPDDAGEPDLQLGTPGTDPGQIVVRGANLFSGYWPDGRGGPDAEGWWATGDIAYAGADGDLFLVDRIGELILVSGFNVYPHEVERVLAAHPAVAEAAVVAAPHPVTGQTVRAYVVRRPGATVDVAGLLGHCAANLARFKCPTSLEFVAELPHSTIGKVRKSRLPGLEEGA
ncbi:AMP-binding protein [Rhizomonospora bruguierae]|uniref:AMP-binding protein n=1 Tax=Rhizomonospora bruguierae TaxID=1581705 RepID=UPI00278C1DB4|nr:AMP-binding protein [Micromonospora sp. NBRC 107566]